MANSDDFLSRVADALEKNQPATEDDLLARFPRVITLRHDNIGYCNPGVTADIDSLSSSEVKYVKFIPLVEDGCVVIKAAAKGETGAVEIVRGDSRRTLTLSLRLALHPFELDLREERKLRFPVHLETVKTAQGEQSILILRVKRPTSKKTTARPRKNGTAKSDKGKTKSQAPASAPPVAPTAAPPAAAPPASADTTAAKPPSENAAQA